MIDGIETVFEYGHDSVSVSKDGITIIINKTERWMNWEKFYISYGKKLMFTDSVKRLFEDFKHDESELTI